MSAQPFYSPKFRAFDANGDPLSGGKLYTYAAGTSTPLDTYTTGAQDVANANPVVLDANGEADVWTTPGVLYKFVLQDANGVTQWTVDNVLFGSTASPSTTDTTGAVEPGGRLTLTTGTPVTTADVTAATTVFYVPHKHDKVPLYDGSAWALYTIATELSQGTGDTTKSPGPVGADSNYDLFIWYDSGTLRLSRGPAWASATTRGAGVGTTELERVGGRYVNKNAISNGPLAQRGLYVGTVHSDGSSQINDSATKRHVWNAHHRVRRQMLTNSTSATWTYQTDAWHQANDSAESFLEVVMGFTEEPLEAEVLAAVTCTVGNIRNSVGIGIDSPSTNSASMFGNTASIVVSAISDSDGLALTAKYSGFPGLGFHYLAWLERSQSTSGNVTTWYGTDNSLPIKSGFRGHLFA